MQISIDINIYKSAFEEDFDGEMNKIIETIREKLQRKNIPETFGKLNYTLLDSNGNETGTLNITHKDCFKN